MSPVGMVGSGEEEDKRPLVVGPFRAPSFLLGYTPGCVHYQSRRCSDPHPGLASKSKSLESLRVTKLRNRSGVQLCLNSSDQDWVSGPSGGGMQPSQ